ncbi:hypothetical protein C8R45DRAFT_921135 [Mycena sanguinolenta]|nr:hypothetical protein C8R45DRAFT_921135 [Mycena sanguinolenta]
MPPTNFPQTRSLAYSALFLQNRTNVTVLNYVRKRRERRKDEGIGTKVQSGVNHPSFPRSFLPPVHVTRWYRVLERMKRKRKREEVKRLVWKIHYYEQYARTYRTTISECRPLWVVNSDVPGQPSTPRTRPRPNPRRASVGLRAGLRNFSSPQPGLEPGSPAIRYMASTKQDNNFLTKKNYLLHLENLMLKPEFDPKPDPVRPDLGSRVGLGIFSSPSPPRPDSSPTRPEQH